MIGALAPGKKITIRETKMVRAYAEGLTDIEAATELGISTGMLNNRKTGLIGKFGVTSMRRVVFKIFRRRYKDW